MTTPTRRFIRRNPLLATFIGLVLFSMLIGYGEDIQSCRRTVRTRQAQQHNVRVLQTIFSQDARRAERYARIDPNHAGVRVNDAYARRHLALIDALHAPPVPGCFPLPGA